MADKKRYTKNEDKLKGEPRLDPGGDRGDQMKAKSAYREI